ncbi:MAG TPA: radical SAM protein [Terriglobia bacterium]|nr:radical SAM protein [Terriglobia bacterium]
MIVLVNPKSAKWKHRLPMSIMSLGALLENRYPYEIVDGNFESDLEGTLARTIAERNAKYLGITVMPGPQLLQAIPLARNLKRKHPKLQIIWGGYFPSLHANVVLQSGFVDFVIRGQGELSFLELIEALETGGAVDQIPGLSFRRGEEIVHSPRRPVTDPNTLPSLPYHRVDVRRYIGKTYLGSRTMTYHSSFGCPFLCGFCAVAALYKSRWVGKKAAAVVDEILLFKREYGVNAVEFVDNNFFVAERRTQEIAAGFQGQRIAWWAEARPDTLMMYSDATWKSMRDSGCKMIFFGAESSSENVLELMDKGGKQTPDMVLELAARAKAFDIIPEFSFVLGTPSDDVGGQIDRDIRYIRRIKAINPNSEIVIYVFSPVFFDDADLLQKSKEFGFSFPQTLEEWLAPQWTSFDMRKQPLTPWLKPRHFEQIFNFERVLNARFPTVSDIKLKTWQTNILKTLGAWRYKLGFYAAPWEIRLVANRFFRYRQPEIEGF